MNLNAAALRLMVEKGLTLSDVADAFMPQTLAFVLCLCQEKNGPPVSLHLTAGLNINGFHGARQCI
jgi:hypothetical protein